MAYEEQDRAETQATNPSTNLNNETPGIVHPPASSPPPKNKPPLLPIAIGLVVALALGFATFQLSDKTKDTPKDKTQDTSQSQPTEAIQSAGTVAITADGFSPATIKVKAGQSITWTNQDDKPHQPATDPYPSQDGLEGFKGEEPLAKNETFSFTFDKPGTYTYHDNLNPLKLKGTVVVE